VLRTVRIRSSECRVGIGFIPPSNSLSVTTLVKVFALACHAAADLLRDKGIDGQQILDAHIGQVVSGQIGHALADVGDHSAGVRAGFSQHIDQRAHPLI
jgi:hypothetical protein